LIYSFILIISVNLGSFKEKRNTTEKETKQNKIKNLIKRSSFYHLAAGFKSQREVKYIIRFHILLLTFNFWVQVNPIQVDACQLSLNTILCQRSSRVLE